MEVWAVAPVKDEMNKRSNAILLIWIYVYRYNITLKKQKDKSSDTEK
jgi:hypothetical protein